MINVSLAFIINLKKYNKGVKKCLVEYVMHVLQAIPKAAVEIKNIHAVIAIVSVRAVILARKIIMEQQFVKHSRRTIKIFLLLTMNILVMKSPGPL